MICGRSRVAKENSFGAGLQMLLATKYAIWQTSQAILQLGIAFEESLKFEMHLFFVRPRPLVLFCEVLEIFVVVIFCQQLATFDPKRFGNS